MSQSPRYTCPVCRHEFGPDEGSNCRLCADKGRCTLICCPNCGYSFPNDSASQSSGKGKFGWLRRRTKKQAD